MKANNSGYTILGYSKSTFGCCTHHNKCKLGRLACVIEERDPEAKEYCMCYQQHHKNKNPFVLKAFTKKEEKFSFPIDEDGQLRSF